MSGLGQKRSGAVESAARLSEAGWFSTAVEHALSNIVFQEEHELGAEHGAVRRPATRRGLILNEQVEAGIIHEPAR